MPVIGHGYAGREVGRSIRARAISSRNLTDLLYVEPVFQNVELNANTIRNGKISLVLKWVHDQITSRPDDIHFVHSNTMVLKLNT